MPLTAVLAELAGVIDVLPEMCATIAARARAREDRGVSVSVATGADAVSESAEAWHAIEHAGGAATPFQSFAMAKAASRVHVQQGETPRVVVVRAHDRPVVIFPTVTGSWNGFRAVRFLGDPLIQYGDVLATPEARVPHLAAAWRAAADPALGQLIYLRKVRADARVARLLARETLTLNPQEAPFVALDQVALQGRAAREVNRLRRRLSERGALRFEVVAGSAAPDAVREALAMKRTWLAERGLPSRVIECRHWEDALVALAQQAHAGLRVARLQVAGTTVAIEVALAQGRTWCAFLGATAPDFAKAGPGHVQMAETIAHCRAEGHEIYDLLAPAEPYKRALGTGSVAVTDHAAALGPVGRLALLLVQSKPLVKHYMDRIPPRLRAALLSMRRG